MGNWNRSGETGSKLTKQVGGGFKTAGQRRAAERRANGEDVGSKVKGVLGKAKEVKDTPRNRREAAKAQHEALVNGTLSTNGMKVKGRHLHK